ncbi:hypothetical protein REI19_003917 [Salmonella enterica]|uniref:hypothetical protein n=1 Tax=Salmonella enterica TaxID=28901 RepID=UPI0027E6FF7B|nr:hypothetical protein [Salmonella enterica]EKD1978131.1 hypothetical protein [Salmonella enterica]EKZ1875615.1 hypothetical protein [Salmonella enterica]ELI6664869.1 hypothetical protein [Salmonella enterica]ELM4150205.1 hypothetical protein [Salmonella enterica]
MNAALTKENDKGSDFTEEWNSIINGIQSFNKHIIEKFFLNTNRYHKFSVASLVPLRLLQI